MKQWYKNILCCLVFAHATSESAPLPPNIINDIVTSDLTPTLVTYASDSANITNTDTDGNTMLMLAAQNSQSYFTTQLYNVNAPAFATIVNTPNTAGVTPLRAAISNPVNAKFMIEFLLRNGAFSATQILLTASANQAYSQLQSGSLDPSFGNGAGFVATPPSAFSAFASAIQPDGKIVTVGPNDNGATVTIRYNIDGTLDSSFGFAGIVTDTTGIFGFTIIIQPDEKIIIGGTDSLSENFQMIRYTANGTIDTTFSGGSVVGPVGVGSMLTLQTDSKILFVGTNNDTELFEVVRYNSNGSIDIVFESGPEEFAQAVQIQSDGKIIVSGNSSTFDLTLVRYNTDGTLDPSFIAGAAPAGLWSGLLLQPNGKIIVAGNTLGLSIMLARFNTDGSLDTTFGGGVITGPTGIMNDAFLQPDGKIILVGLPSDQGPTFQIIRYNSNGTLDTSFGTAGIVEAPPGAVAFSGALQQNGRIVAVGSNSAYTIAQIARYIGGPALTPTTLHYVNRTSQGAILSGTAQNPSKVYIFGGDVLLGGTFTDSQGTNTWSFATPNYYKDYRVMAIYPDGALNTAYERMWLASLNQN